MVFDLYIADWSSMKTIFVLMTLSRKEESRKLIHSQKPSIQYLSCAGPDRYWSVSQLILGKKQVTP